MEGVRQQPVHKSNVKEDDALTRLKLQINAPATGLGSNYDSFLLRFLKNKNLNVGETAKKLARRREFEKTLPSQSISQEVVTALRSKAFVVLPQDVLRRPVLYIRMGLYRFSDSASDQKLAIVILEYLQYLCWCANTSEFVVLMNEDETGWFRTKSALQEHLLEILQKYYPELLGSLLIVNASWVVAQGVKSTVVNKSSKIKNRTTFVKPKELTRFLENAAIPFELGGQNNINGSANDFSEQCLRYWYNVTSIIKVEQDNGGGGGGFLKTLWQPLPSLVPGVVGNSLSHPRNSAMLNKGGALKGISSMQTLQGGGGASPGPGGATAGGGGSVRRARGNSVHSERGGPLDDATDDGCCSVISEGDLDEFAWTGKAEGGGDGMSPGVNADDDRLAGSENNSFRRRGGDNVGGGSAADEDMAALRQQLGHEARRRRDLELKVQSLELGAPIVSGQGLTKLETALRSSHEEVNVLVSEVVLQGKRKHKGDPTLLNLLEMTNAGLQQVIQDKPTVNAMRFAQPVDRKPPGKCSIM